MKTNRLDSMRDEGGKLPGVAWPGGYTITYYFSDGSACCAQCANGENGSEAHTTCDDVDAFGSRCQWHLVAHDVHWEGPSEFCAHCNKEIPSAYGDPDESEGEE